MNKMSKPPIVVIDNKRIDNSMEGALFGMQRNPFGAQVSQTDTIFHNMRYYLISNNRQILSEAYLELGLVQTVVDVPVDDAFRGGVEIKTKLLSEDQIDQLQMKMEEEDDIGSVTQSRKWNRLFGGAGILILTGQGMEEPLDIDAIDEDSYLEFRAVDMWELFYDKVNSDNFDSQLHTHNVEYYSYYGRRIHRSRVLITKGITPPSFMRPRLRGWGTSVVEALVRSINQFLKSSDLTFEVLDEFKVDVYMFDQLASTLLSSNGEERVQKRVHTANRSKNFLNSIIPL